MENIVNQFPVIVALCLHQNSGSNYERNKDILAKRFGLDEEPIYTLDDLGTYYGLTRERVRQIEAQFITRLAKLLHGNHICQSPEINTLLIEDYRAIKNEFDNRGSILADSEAHSILVSMHGQSIRTGYFDLFMELSGYVRMSNSVTGFRGTLMPCWCNPQKQKRHNAERLISSLDFIFDKVDPLSLFDVTLTVKKTYRGDVSNSDIHTALKVCADVEVTDNFVSVKLNFLRSAADKAYRILSTERKPMHYAEICREINARGVRNSTNKALRVNNLTNQMVSDPRFTPIGRSGRWGLSSWKHLNNMTIVEAMEATLHRAGKALTFNQMSDGVHQLRPDASDRSIHAYLGMADKFVHATNERYGLAAWQLKDSVAKAVVQRIPDEAFFSAVRDAFAEAKEISYPTLINSVRAATGLSESSVRGRIAGSSHLRLESRSGCRSKYVMRLAGMEGDNRPPSRKLLRDKVQEEVRSILFDNPNKPFRKINLYREAKKTISCQQATFYHYLSEMKDVRQYRDGNSYFAVYENMETIHRIELNLDKYGVAPLLAKELDGSLSRLTKDEVDIALLELGRIFERKLRTYLEAAKMADVIRVNRRDMSRLVDMIDCLVREGVVRKGHHLHTLREERNMRAHGVAPTVDERSELFNRAHYIANLFVQYIAFLENARKAIQEKHDPALRQTGDDHR